jgi:isocitrate lyase
VSQLGVNEIKGHLMFAIPESDYNVADTWLERFGLIDVIADAANTFIQKDSDVDVMLDEVIGRFLEAWQLDAGLKTYTQAVADTIQFRMAEGKSFDVTVDEWLNLGKHASWSTVRAKARMLGIDIKWDPELAKTPDGYYQVQGGIDYAIAKCLAAAPFADILWMETNTANLAEAREFAENIRAVFPDKMLAYNLSPSFNWDTTGMSEEEMRCFPEELGKLGFVFNFITYGGHQIDGGAAEEFATALKDQGMLALAQLQRRIRLVESPYRAPQTLVGGQRLDAALMACSGRTATTKAMGKGSTQHQHLVQTEVPTTILDEWLKLWSDENKFSAFRSRLRPLAAGSDFLELSILNSSSDKVANVVFADLQDRYGNKVLSIRDQNTFDVTLRRKRLMTLAHLFLIHRYKAEAIHYLSPTEDNQKQTQRMKALGILKKINMEAGLIIVATIEARRVAELLHPNRNALGGLISKAVSR